MYDKFTNMKPVHAPGTIYIDEDEQEFKRLALLRCEFAAIALALALAGILASHNTNVFSFSHQETADEAVKYADALIAELLKPKEDK